VSRRAATASSCWVIRHFGDWIRTFTFIPTERSGHDIPVYDSKKIDHLKRLGHADVFIEDNEANIKGTDKLGIKSFVISRPWNSSTTTIGEILQELNSMNSNNGVCETKGKSR
jgi:hypothetical protein